MEIVKYGETIDLSTERHTACTVIDNAELALLGYSRKDGFFK